MEWTEKMSQQMSRERKGNNISGKGWTIASLASIPLVMTLGNSMLIPVLPTIEKQLQITSFQSSLLITVYSIVAILLIPIAGYFSDRIGRKKVIIPSLFIAAAGGIISGWASWKMSEPYGMILVGRMLQGIGAAGAFPIVLPLVGDLFKKDSEASSCLGTIETANTFGKVASPIVGSVLAGIIWFLLFFAFPLFCAISIVMMIFFVKSPTKMEQPPPFREFLRNVKAIFYREGRWLYAVFFIGGAFMFVLFGELFFLSSMLEDDYGIDGLKKGWILAIPLGALCVASFITGKKIGKNKRLMKWLIVIGGVIAAATIAFAFMFRQLWWMIALFFVSGVGIGIVLPCLDALITEGIEKKERGTVTSFYSSMRFIGVAAGPPVAALLMKQATNTMFYGFAGLCVLSSIITLMAIKPEKEGREIG
ncbi:MFS transporter [Thermaerobacillus caldiproteolyticus]|uniref:ACDE family multidrug resistance protein n=1 Tax=Thermaerobacillus caldiproteolyticus TaxID=247480 RepID=A0A7V9Z5A4_9BACL|nr:MFS transporter [Anoxybacillus caldiproteolyticus]MBA2874276.1 ACDE family multidrug resistance protein [Anoxybacillus caldiproteolyticus]QPA31795.1 MFS transporter [Anoxybacillus caldiproteolyticus]